MICMERIGYAKAMLCFPIINYSSFVERGAPIIESWIHESWLGRVFLRELQYWNHVKFKTSFSLASLQKSARQCPWRHCRLSSSLFAPTILFVTIEYYNPTRGNNRLKIEEWNPAVCNFWIAKSHTSCQRHQQPIESRRRPQYSSRESAHHQRMNKYFHSR